VFDRAKMRLYDCEQSAQVDILDDAETVEYNKSDESKAKFDDFKF
jgi:hypothetical protein